MGSTNVALDKNFFEKMPNAAVVVFTIVAVVVVQFQNREENDLPTDRLTD